MDCHPMKTLLETAIRLSENESADMENIPKLGKGWTGDEALAIAVYCALRHSNDFSSAVVAAVNHGGDSDSTGAITGNILGAWLGYDAIDNKWKRNLELKNVILEMADDLFNGCPLDEYYDIADPIWLCKYVLCRYAATREEAERIIQEDDM
jgi:ADP-ribosylglycohydrolase